MENVVNCPYKPSTTDIPATCFAQTLLHGLEKDPSAIAFENTDTGEQLTFHQVQQKSNSLAVQLMGLGCRKGDVMAIYSPNSIEWVIVTLAAHRIGVVAAGINSLLTVGELRHQLSISEAKLIYTTRELADAALQVATYQIIVKGGYKGCIALESLFNVEDAKSQLPSFEQLNLRPDEPALILFSSGTTGPQKAVILTNRNLNAELVVHRHEETESVYPQQIAYLPLSHIGGYASIIFALALGYKTFIMPRFDFRTLLKLLKTNQIEKHFLVPPVATLLAKSPDVDEFRPSHLRMIFCGAAPLSSETEDIIMTRFPGMVVRQCYGMSETTGICSGTPSRSRPAKRKPGSIGVPSINVQMKVVDIANGKSLGPGQEGEICMKSPANTPGYKGNPEATATLIDKDGWLHSGDIGHYDEDGYFYVVDRLKELIKYKAYQVAPAELESVLLSHPDVADAGVFGIPDSMAGELPTAWAVLKLNANINDIDLQKFVSEKVAPYKRLRGGIRLVSEIPKSPSGKILRRLMKDAALKGKL